MSFGDDVSEIEPVPIPRLLPGPFEAQDFAAGRAGVSWEAWALSVLTIASASPRPWEDDPTIQGAASGENPEDGTLRVLR